MATDPALSLATLSRKRSNSVIVAIPHHRRTPLGLLLHGVELDAFNVVAASFEVTAHPAIDDVGRHFRMKLEAEASPDHVGLGTDFRSASSFAPGGKVNES